MTDDIGRNANSQPADQDAAPAEPIEPRPASTSRRIVAFVLDVGLVSAFHLSIAGRQWPVTATVYALYQTISLTVWGSTLGKAVMGLRVQTPDGRRLGWGWALLRSTGGYLASAFPLLGLGFLYILVDPRRRGWHDLLCRSQVIQQAGALSLKQVGRVIDRWTSDLDAWQKRVLAPLNRLRGLMQLLVKITGLITLAQRVAEQLVRTAANWLERAWHRLRSVLGRTGEGPAASGLLGGSPVLSAVASTATVVVLAGSTVIMYESTMPLALRPWAAPPSTTLAGDCQGTITPSATRGNLGAVIRFTIAIKPPFDRIITRVVTNNPRCMACPADQIGPGRFTWSGRLVEPVGTVSLEFVAHDKDGNIRCRGDSPEIMILGRK